MRRKSTARLELNLGTLLIQNTLTRGGNKGRLPAKAGENASLAGGKFSENPEIGRSIDIPMNINFSRWNENSYIQP